MDEKRLENGITRKFQNVPEVNNAPLKMETTDNAVLILFYLMGTISAVPSHFFITASNFWMYKFRDLTGDVDKTKMQTEFFSTFSTVSACTSVAALGIAVTLANRISINVRLLFSMVIMAFLFFVTILLTGIDTDQHQKELYGLVMVIGAILNAAGGCFFVPMFQLASKFPPTYLAAQMTGSSLCGTLASIVQIVTIALVPNNTGSGFLYFIVGGTLILSGIIFYTVMHLKSEYFKERLAVEEREETEASKGDNPKAFSKETFITVFKKNGIVLASMVCVMGTSTMLHPGVTSLISSTHPGTEWSNLYYVPVCCYFIFNFAELIGKEFARRFHIKLKQWYLLTIGASRMLIILPLILFCNLQPRKHLPVILNDDSAFIILMIIFAFTSGYFANLCIFSLPSLADPKEMKIAFLMILVFMVVTLASFSFFGILLVKLI